LSSLGEIISKITDISQWAAVRSEQTFAEATSENIFYTLFARNYSIYMPIAIFLFIKGELSKKVFYSIFIYGLLTSIINFSRGPLLEFVLVSFVSYVLIKQSFKIPILKIILVIIVFIFIFIFSQSVLFSLNDYSVFDASYQIKMYLFGGVNNYQLILDGLYPDKTAYSSPFYSFDFINYILKRLSLIDSYPEQVRAFNNFIDGSNVYTYLDAFTLDFGIIGAFIGSFFIGYFSKKVYFKYDNNKSIVSLIIYSIICYFAVMSFINNEYIRFSFLLFIIKIYIIELIIRFPENIVKHFKINNI
jgi:oligosaccharide repeat unit polymerase